MRSYFLKPFLKSDKLVHRNYKEDKGSEVVNTSDPLHELIFAADPITGLPRSDLQIIMAKDANSEVSNYIRDNLLQSHNSGGTQNPDEALVCTRTQMQPLSELKKDIVDFVEQNK